MFASLFCRLQAGRHRMRWLFQSSSHPTVSMSWLTTAWKTWCWTSAFASTDGPDALHLLEGYADWYLQHYWMECSHFKTVLEKQIMVMEAAGWNAKTRTVKQNSPNRKNSTLYTKRTEQMFGAWQQCLISCMSNQFTLSAFSMNLKDLYPRATKAHRVHWRINSRGTHCKAYRTNVWGLTMRTKPSSDKNIFTFNCIAAIETIKKQELPAVSIKRIWGPVLWQQAGGGSN